MLNIRMDVARHILYVIQTDAPVDWKEAGMSKRQILFAGESIESLRSEILSLRAELERVRGAVDIVNNLSEWSLKYPRNRIYPMQRQDKMDGELITIEKAAKDFTQQTEGGGDAT